MKKQTEDFLKRVEDRLRNMTEEEKTAWILRQAKLAPADKQDDFLLSLAGEKPIMDMPSVKEINEFCEKVESEEIYFEYETHYYEFDDDGRYMDDWKIWHNDPFGAARFLDRIFEGCSGLLLLNEFQTVADVLGKVLNLRFHVETAEDSEDSAEEDFLSVPDAEKEGMFSIGLNEAGECWIRACVRLWEKEPAKEMAVRLIRMLEHPACKGVKPRVLLEEELPQKIFEDMKEILEKEIRELESEKDRLEEQRERLEKGRWYPLCRQIWEIREKADRKEEILSDIIIKCVKASQPVQEKAADLSLEEGWRKILEMIKWLSYERVIDDQPEIDEIQEICEKLLHSGRLPQEKWEIRRKVLADIIANEYYDYYSCGDIMDEMAGQLCTGKFEYLQLADIMDQYAQYKGKAAEIYHKYGRDDKYVSYLEAHLGRDSREYSALIAFYKENGKPEEAERVAKLGLENCKGDLTDCFLFLLQRAREKGDELQFQKLSASAKRRKKVDADRIHAFLKGQKA